MVKTWLFPWEFFSLLLKLITGKHFYASEKLIWIWWEGWRWWCVSLRLLRSTTFSSFSLPSSIVDLFISVWTSAFLLLLLGGTNKHIHTRFICSSAKAILPSLQTQTGAVREESVILHIQLGKTRRWKNCQEWNNIASDCIFRWAAPYLFPGFKSNELELQS